MTCARCAHGTVLGPNGTYLCCRPHQGTGFLKAAGDHDSPAEAAASGQEQTDNPGHLHRGLQPTSAGVSVRKRGM